jgi:hypothetical protein
MAQHAADAGKKLLAIAVLLIAAWILLKIVIGFVATIAWVVVAVVAVIAILWAIRTL